MSGLWAKLNRNPASAYVAVCVRCHSWVRYAHDAEVCEGVRREKHVYKTLYPWGSKAEFVEQLKQTVCYNEDGLVVLSKPYGVPLTVDYTQRGRAVSLTKRRLHVTGFGESPYSLEDALEGLSQHLNHKRLFCIKSAERYASGLTLLAADEGAAEKARRALLRAKPMLLPYITAWVIVKGYPTQETFRERVGMKFVPVDEEEKQAVIVRDFGSASVKKGTVKPVTVECRTLAKNPTLSVSLLEIATTSAQWHFFRAYSASKASCVLGDLGYASHVANVLGKPLLLSPGAAATSTPQVTHAPMWSLNLRLTTSQRSPAVARCNPGNPEDLVVEANAREAVCRRLEVAEGTRGHRMVPAMVHYRSLLLPHYRGKGEHLLLVDPGLPRHFAWTLDRLGTGLWRSVLASR
ncbi:hypothetical protein HPB47_011674 [Ixodes persulcatus]|uniref:Uncharacterized protein n=1 Tax=Ixodes persulcatus TaxID=34615 RepID=A0AC60NWJ1_IXOPE|nr:hypothetical protein HPB47_011674 [Ixodes persulcatus]